MPATAGGTRRAADGTSPAMPQKQPVQIGKSGLPCSNSIHTPEPIGGTVNSPICSPATGTHGIAQLVGSTLDTSGTIAWIRPICIGSTLLTTVPRYLPKYFATSFMSIEPSRPYAGTLPTVDINPFLTSVKFCRYCPRLMSWVTLFT